MANELFGLEAYAPQQIAARVSEVGVAKARLSPICRRGMMSACTPPRARSPP